MMNPIEADESPLEDETLFSCACGDEGCKGHNDDPANIRIGREWFAADCRTAANHPEVIRSREQDDRNRRTRNGH